MVKVVVVVVCVCVLGVAWGCRWVYEDNGVWKETCYCDDRDGCNTSSLPAVPLRLASLLLIVAAVTLLHRIVWCRTSVLFTTCVFFTARICLFIWHWFLTWISALDQQNMQFCVKMCSVLKFAYWKYNSNTVGVSLKVTPWRTVLQLTCKVRLRQYCKWVV